MPKCTNPLTTGCLIGVWLLVVPGVLLTHLAVSKVTPAIGDFPKNLVKGFEVTFKFAQMTDDAKKIQDASSAVVVGKCNVPSTDLNATCQAATNSPTFNQAQMVNVSTKEQKDAIVAAFDASLGIVRKVTNDKFFGIEQFNNSAEQLNKIIAEIEKIDANMQCNVAIPVFCTMYLASDALIQGKAMVDEGIGQFKDSDAVKQWDERKGVLTFLHAVPYILVIGMLFFMIFWFCGATCCCCKKSDAPDAPRGNCPACLALIPYALLWLLAIILNSIVVGVGWVLTNMKDQIEIPSPPMRTKTNLEELVKHIQTEYADFWNVVFKDLVDGLGMLMQASQFFVVACLLIMLYSLCVCCCNPYKQKTAGSE